MGKIIAVASGKGGTGKTTFTANTALALAAMGQRVLCLDCDITLRNLDLALGLSDRALMDFSDVMEGRCTLDEAAVPHEKYPSLFLLTAPMADRPLTLSVTGIQNLARAIREKFDWCLIDAPAGLGQGFQMAACMADQVIVITTTDVSAMRDAQRTAAELAPALDASRADALTEQLDRLDALLDRLDEIQTTYDVCETAVTRAVESIRM